MRTCLRTTRICGVSWAGISAVLEVEVLRGSDVWNPEDFGREQIRGLVQRVCLCRAEADL